MKTKVDLPSVARSSLLVGERLSPEWQRFFTSLYDRVGGNSPQEDDIDEADGSLADATRAINEIIAALKTYRVTSD